MSEKESELKGVVEVVTAGALGGLCSWIGSWMEALPAVPLGHNIATLAGSVFIGAIIGYICSTVLIGFSKPGIKKLMAISCLCGILWMPLCGYLPYILSKVFAMVDIQKMAKAASESALHILDGKDVTPEQYTSITDNACNLVKRAHGLDGDGGRSATYPALHNTIQALSQKAKDNPTLASKALFKIGAVAAQLDYTDIAKEAERALLTIPGVDSKMIGLMYGHLPDQPVKRNP